MPTRLPSSWLNRNPDHASLPSLMSMAEYGPSVATPRILDLLDSHSIKASFYVPGYVAETHVGLVEDIARRGHEVAHHGYMHEPPATLTPEQEEEVLHKGISILRGITPEQEEEVLHKGISILRGITGEAPRGYRSPSWELSEKSVELLACHDFLYDSSLMGDDAPYVLEVMPSGGDGGTPRRLVEIPIHWLLDDAPNFVYAPVAGRMGPMRSPDEVYGAWVCEFEGLYRYGRAFTLTMHPQHIGRPGRLMMLDRLIRHIRGFPDVEFMRGIDVAEMWASR